MKRYILKIVFILALVLCLFSCSKSEPILTKELEDSQSVNTEERASLEIEPTETPHQELLKGEWEGGSLPIAKEQSLNLSEIGLMGVQVEKKVETSLGSSDHPLYAYVLGDFRYVSSSSVRDSYLAVETGSKILFFDFGGMDFGTELYACDLNGDGVDEFLVHQMLGTSGGAGQYATRGFKLSGENLIELFCFDSAKPFETGFQCEFLPGKKLEITNVYYDHVQVFDISTKYIEEAFDETGTCVLPYELYCDHFFEIKPTNADGDAAFELECLQYVSLGSHADGIGVAKTILKYKESTQSFAVIQGELQSDLPEV